MGDSDVQAVQDVTLTAPAAMLAAMQRCADEAGIPTVMIDGIVTCNCEDCIAERGN